MSVPTAPPAPPATAAPAAPPPAGPSPGRLRGALRRNRLWLAVAAALLVALGLSVWATSGDPKYSTPLDPQNPDPDGAQAIAQVLGDQGVEVDIVRSADALHDARVDATTTVLVTRTDQLAPSTLERLLSDTEDADVVLVAPSPPLLDALEDGVQSAFADDSTTGGCPDARFDDLRLAVDRAESYDTDTGCFPSGGGFVLATGTDGLSYFGAGEALSNDQVLRDDNAAIALRLLGAHDRLVWYIPSYDDATDGETVSLWSFAPRWLVPSLWLVLVTTVALIWWRGRRLGRLSVEPLPVVVRAVETTRSRGRMYRQADDRAYASASLRAAGRRRLAAQLRLGRGATEAEVIGAVARHLGRREEEVAPLLAHHAPAPTSDQDLVALAQALTELDREVRRR
ncbi:DUF4350 domain-containing protein [Nocardioides sp. MH1]|uniref:DUF4350 domain-containing protein n=1 Tax=Nocardioides sp. MH1 TaxID=3242490 RepID=UPI00351F8554